MGLQALYEALSEGRRWLEAQKASLYEPRLAIRPACEGRPSFGVLSVLPASALQRRVSCAQRVCGGPASFVSEN